MVTIGMTHEDTAAAQKWDKEIARRALDELFHNARQYRTTDDYWELMKFIVRFRDLAPYNAMLVRTQMPGAVYVASATRWTRDYGRTIKLNARPLVILQPMGPVMFVFDVSDTSPGPNAIPLPRQIEHPFATRGGQLGAELRLTVRNAIRDGIEVLESRDGSQNGGLIQTVSAKRWIRFDKRLPPNPEFIDVALRYAILLNSSHSAETRYATLVHELAHLYCGHLGTPNTKWWPDRRFVSDRDAEFEAESVSYLVCQRLGIDTPAESYLASYVQRHQETPVISLDIVLKAARIIEEMGRQRLGLRNDE